MAKLYYRGMAEQSGKPKIGRSARLLGIRPGVDIDVATIPQDWLDDQGYLRPESGRENYGEWLEVVLRNHKGMSTSLSIEALPPFRKPEAFGGVSKDPLWQIDDRDISGDLDAVQDSTTHISILPSATMLLERYEAAIANTQDDWNKVDDNGMGI